MEAIALRLQSYDFRPLPEFTMPLLSTLLFSVFQTIAFIPICSRLALALDAVDIPDARRVHSRPTPRSGGLAMALGMGIPVVLWVPLDPFARAFLASAALILVFGLLDDVRDLDCRVKLAVQVMAAVVVVAWGGVEVRSAGDLLPAGMVLPRLLGVAAAVFVIVGVTNAINFSDGLDGLAGGISMLGFIALAFMAHEAGDAQATMLSVAVIGAVFGFLRFNTHPANLFMGDSGSQLLGFAAITLAFRLSQAQGDLSPLVPLLLLGFPILDTLAVVGERLAAGRSPFVADRNHFHHKLMRVGLEHDEAVFVIYVLQSVLVSAAFLMRFQSEWLILLFYSAFSGAILTGFHLAEVRGWRWPRDAGGGSWMVRHLTALRESGFAPRLSFRAFEIGLIALLVATWAIPDGIPWNVAAASWGCVAVLGAVRIVRQEWLGTVLRVILYLSIPFAVYLSETDPHPGIPPSLLAGYDMAFGALVLLVVMTLKLTRRNRGFRVTPMDFLTIFVALVAPNLPDARVEALNLGMLSAKILVLFFSFEVLMGELRGDYRLLFRTTFGVLGIVGVRGFF